MNQEVNRILNMVAEGKVSIDEAQRLIEALQSPAAMPASTPRQVRYLHVLVDAQEKEGEQARAKVNVRVPIKLLRAGIKLGALLPREAATKVEGALEQKGLSFDLSAMKPEDVEEFIEGLQDMEVDVNSGEAKVRVYCE